MNYPIRADKNYYFPFGMVRFGNVLAAAAILEPISAPRGDHHHAA